MALLLRLGLVCVVGVACLVSVDEINERNKLNIDGEETLNVPFSSQAPDKNWYEPWLNACEETSILMVDSFYEGDDEIGVEQAKKQILDILAVKNSEIDTSLDESLETMLVLIDELDLGWKGVIKESPTLSELKLELEAKRPFIVPVYAPELNNPYYTGGGPDYHVMVVKGYNSEKEIFVVNDPGTQFGEDLEFSYDVLMKSIHDLDQNDYDAGRKRVLFTEVI